MLTFIFLTIGLVIVVGLLMTALIEALNIPNESIEHPVTNTALFEFPNLFPWPLK